ncbi:perlucin-like protein [Branchiostoma floridae]|uniref:Perlucin-like protein n=1 Tax=Branchiostoma floridae TaxID=7739 RepID=A0A9J7MAV5_BRAFL|nr:perlucin-like protein [Branchiostoma floridae]
MGVLVVVVVLAVLQHASGAAAPECSEDKCVCSPAIYVDYGDKKETDTTMYQLRAQLTLLQGTVESLRTQQDVRLAELQEQFSKLTSEIALLKQYSATTKLVCPSGYVKFEDKCFSFSTDQKNYTDARSACQADGGHLAMPKDQATDAFLRNQLTRYPSGSIVWFGLTDLLQEGTFVWEDGTPLTGWDNWNPGQPDDSGSAEDCAHWYSSSGKWNDRPCSVSQYYVCEVSP